MTEPHLPSAAEKSVYVNHMFARIAPTYDVMNRLMTLGQDQGWRRELLAQCDLPVNGRLLDVGTGTGDIGYEALRLYPSLQVVASDFTYEMMAAGASKGSGADLSFVQADVNVLPYPSESFDAVVSGFLIRNVVDRLAVFREMARVTKPGGRVACLETTPSAPTLVGWGRAVYFEHIVPLVGAIVTGDREAYTYLPQSTAGFPSPDELLRTVEEAGLHGAYYRTLMLGSVAIHVGIK